MKTWLAASAALFLATTATRAQLDAPTDVNILGSEAAQRRATRPPETYAWTQARPELKTDAYAQTLKFRGGNELHGLFILHTADEIFWQRMDASEVLRFARCEITEGPSVRIVPNELDDPPLRPRAVASKGETGQTPVMPSSMSPLFADAPIGRWAAATLLTGTLLSPLAEVPSICLLSQQPAPVRPDLLIFKNGDELPGRMLSASLGGPLRWRTIHGQEVDFQTGRIAGVRLGRIATARGSKSGAESEATVELRTGERVRGELLALDEKQLRLESAQFGPLTLDRAQLRRLYPHAQFGPFDGGCSPVGWQWVTPKSHGTARAARPVDDVRWLCLDGTYLPRSRFMNGQSRILDFPHWQHSIDSHLERFEIRFEVEKEEQRLTCHNYITLADRNGLALYLLLRDSDLEWGIADPPARPEVEWHTVSFEKLTATQPSLAVRLFVDTKAGTGDLLINGQQIVQMGKAGNERLRPSRFTLYLTPFEGMPIFTNLWIGPWSGEAPSAARQSAHIVFRNGDIMPGAPAGWRDGKWQPSGEPGNVDVPPDNVSIVDFGGAMQTASAVARVRLIDGSSLDVDAFQWDGRVLTAHSAACGSVRTDANAVSELILDPVLPHAPLSPKAGQTTGQNAATSEERLPAQ